MARNGNIRLLMLAIPNEAQAAAEVFLRSVATTPADYFFLETVEEVEDVYNSIAAAFVLMLTAHPKYSLGGLYGFPIFCCRHKCVRAIRMTGSQ